MLPEAERKKSWLKEKPWKKQRWTPKSQGERGTPQRKANG